MAAPWSGAPQQAWQSLPPSLSAAAGDTPVVGTGLPPQGRSSPLWPRGGGTPPTAQLFLEEESSVWRTERSQSGLAALPGDADGEGVGAQAWAKNTAAEAMLCMGEVDEALTKASEALALYRSIDNRLGQASALQTMAPCLQQRRQTAEAMECLQQAAALYRSGDVVAAPGPPGRSASSQEAPPSPLRPKSSPSSPAEAAAAPAGRRQSGGSSGGMPEVATFGVPTPRGARPSSAGGGSSSAELLLPDATSLQAAGWSPSAAATSPRGTGPGGSASRRAASASSRIAGSGEEEGGLPRHDDLVSRLLDIGDSFKGFDKVVEEDTLRRRHVEHKRLQEVLDGLARLEKALNVEIRRRIETHKNTQEASESLLTDMMSRLQARLSKRFEQLTASLQALLERCCSLENNIRQFKGELPTKVQMEQQQLLRDIRAISVEFEHDRKQMSEQDAKVSQMISESEYGIDVRLQQESEALDTRAEGLERGIAEYARVDDSRRSAILGHIQQLELSIAEEGRSREKADDRVVQAINEYTSSLQRSLSKASV